MSSSAPTWYYADAGERVGPRTLDEMRALRAEGGISPETLVWTPGLSAWMPMSELPVLQLPPEAPDPAPEAETAPLAAPRPAAAAIGAAHAWRRFIARSIDMGIPVTIVFSLAGVTQDAIWAGSVSPLLNVLSAGLWVPFEALMIALTGTTPGKALLGIRVATADGQRPGPARSLARAARVWVQGIGLGLPLVILITEAFGYARLTRTGITPWDAELSLRVEYERMGPFRLVAVGLFIFAALLALGSVVQG